MTATGSPADGDHIVVTSTHGDLRGEWRDGVGGLAATVFNGFERPVAALGISGPLDRLTPARMKTLAPRVIEVAAQLSRSMGYTKGYFGESV